MEIHFRYVETPFNDSVTANSGSGITDCNYEACTVELVRCWVRTATILIYRYKCTSINTIFIIIIHRVHKCEATLCVRVSVEYVRT